MDFTEKAGKRIEHWLEHNENHIKEYEAFAEQLQQAGEEECAKHILAMAELTRQSSTCLTKAVDALSD